MTSCLKKSDLSNDQFAFTLFTKEHQVLQMRCRQGESENMYMCVYVCVK